MYYKFITGFPNYLITYDGYVISTHSGTPKYLSPLNTDGYLAVVLCSSKGQKRVGIHRLVAEAFIPNPSGKPFINHINCNPSCNRADNLEWCTQSENILHSYATGRRVIDTEHRMRASVLGVAKRKLTMELANEVRTKYTGMRGDIANLARQYGIDRKGIRYIVNNLAYKE